MRNRRLYSAALLGIVITASQQLRQEQQRPSHAKEETLSYDEWMEFQRQLSSDPETALKQLRAFQNKNGVGLEFWVREGVLDAQLESLGWHPVEGACGKMVLAFVERIPTEHMLVDGDLAVELDASGLVLKKWTVPANAVHLGLDGDRVLVPLYGGRFDWSVAPHLSIGTDGWFELVLANAGRQIEMYPCPAIAEFGVSAYLRCWVIKNESSEEARRIAYQGPCT